MVDLLSAIIMLSAKNEMDPYLVAAVVQVESRFDTRAIGSLGEIGLMQLLPQYFAKDGKTEALFDPIINLERGIKYLSDTKRLCRHKGELEHLVCYNAGILGGSKIKHPTEFHYYVRVKGTLESFKRTKIFSIVDQGLRLESGAAPGSNFWRMEREKLLRLFLSFNDKTPPLQSSQKAKVDLEVFYHRRESLLEMI